MFNFFKKKQEYQPHDPLDRLLYEAAINPSKRPDFYRKIFLFDLLLMADKDENGELSCQSTSVDGEETFFAFTSEAALANANNLSDQNFGVNGRFLTMRTYDLFSMLANSGRRVGFILNSQLHVGRHFNSNDIKSALEETNLSDKQIELKENSQIKLRIPEEPPTFLLEQLKQFVERSTVLNDILFGLQSYSGETSFICLLCPKAEVNEEKVQSELKDIFTFISEFKLEYPIDLGTVNEQYQEAHRAGALMSVLIPAEEV